MRKSWNHICAAALLVLCLCLAVSPVFAKGDLSAKQARKLIAGMSGFGLKTGSVHLLGVRSVDVATAQATAEIATAFRLERNSGGQWRVSEFRTGQDQWENVDLISRVLKFERSASACDAIETARNDKPATDPSNRRSRCLLAELLGTQLPSDAVRIKEVSSMGLPFSSKASALVEALITADFQFTKGDKGAWRVSAIRTGTHNWVDPQFVFNAVNGEKNVAARSELAALARALEDFRRHRGFYVETKSEAVLVDLLSPRYLARVIRVDPWRRPYMYEGTRDRFTLRSTGPDGKDNTPDDIVLSGPTTTN